VSRCLARMSPQAAAWLKDEIAYVADRNPAAARKIAERIRAAREKLADHPMIGPAGTIPDTRRFVVKPYVFTVRQREGVLEIAAIRNARQGDAYAPGDILDAESDDEPLVDL
jgi:plasmid stabilization system protein ParE